VSEPITITVFALPQPQLGEDVTLCGADSVMLDVTMDGATYLWSNGDTKLRSKFPQKHLAMARMKFGLK